MRLLTSVRARVTLGAMAAFTIALALIGWGIIQLVGTTLINDAGRIAQVQARNLAIVAEVGRLGPVLDTDSAGTIVLQVVTADGEVLSATPQLRDMPPIMGELPDSGVMRTSTVHLATMAHPAADYRVVGIGTESTSGPIVVLAGVSLTEVSTTITTVTRLLTIGFTLMGLIVAGIVWGVITRALRPVERIRTEVQQITDADLSRRVPTGTYRDEIHRLATTMNSMLTRLEASSVRQQAFIADASHELRSPLASLRAQLEVTAAHPQGADVVEVATEALVDVQRLQDLTDDLLLLTRMDATAPPRGQVVDLDELVATTLARRRNDRLPVHFSPGAGALVHGDRSHLERLVTNLVDNAVRHGVSRVDVACRAGELIRLEVADDGPGVAPEDGERIFDRFVRMDAPRSRADGGTGLGLAIVRDIARAHGGSVIVKDSPVGALFVCSFPPVSGS